MSQGGESAKITLTKIGRILAKATKAEPRHASTLQRRLVIESCCNIDQPVYSLVAFNFYMP